MKELYTMVMNMMNFFKSRDRLVRNNVSLTREDGFWWIEPFKLKLTDTLEVEVDSEHGDFRAYLNRLDGRKNRIGSFEMSAYSDFELQEVLGGVKGFNLLMNYMFMLAEPYVDMNFKYPLPSNCRWESDDKEEDILFISGIETKITRLSKVWAVVRNFQKDDLFEGVFEMPKDHQEAFETSQRLMNLYK